MMWSKAFWISTAERAVSTFAQTLGAVLVANGTGLLDSNWVGTLSASGMAALLSALKSVGQGSMSAGDPSLTHSETAKPV